MPPSCRGREKLTSLLDRRIGQKQLDDWKSLRRFYAAVAQHGGHETGVHMSQSAIGSSEALMGQLPCSTFAKVCSEEPLREKTRGGQANVTIYVIAVEASPQWQRVLY